MCSAFGEPDDKRFGKHSLLVLLLSREPEALTVFRAVEDLHVKPVQSHQSPSSQPGSLSGAPSARRRDTLEEVTHHLGAEALAGLCQRTRCRDRPVAPPNTQPAQPLND